MKRVGRKDTAPELIVRRYLHARGLRYRLHSKSLPGTPDLVLPARRTVIFVHGCFWHGHECTHGAIRAQTNRTYWDAKIRDNRARDLRKVGELCKLGWWVETIWECECSSPARLRSVVRKLMQR